MPRILISYRREDAAAYAGRLFDRLSDFFGHDNIFMDIDTIRPGQDFKETITSSVVTCDALLAVIGKRWLTEQDTAGARRLDRPDDLLRVEISTALGRGVTVIPVLVGGASMPDAASLPADLAKLARLQALQIDDVRFNQDVHRLIETLKDIPDRSGGHVTSRALARFVPSGRGARLAAAGAVVLAVLVYIAATFGPRADQGTSSGPPSAGTAAPSGSVPAPQGTSSTPAPDNRRPAQQPAPAGAFDRPELVAGSPPAVRALPELGTLDDAQRIEAGVTYRLLLEDGEAAFMALAKPVSDLLVVMDMRPGDGVKTNLQGQLAILDADGAMLDASAIRFNQIDYGYRRVGTISLGRKPRSVRLKILNGHRRNLYWLTVFTTARVPFVPLFGQITPLPMRNGEAAGRLDRGEEAFYIATLKRGTYKVFVDLTNTPRTRTNIQAYLAVMDAFGGNQDAIIHFNQIDYEFRKIATLIVKSDGVVLFRLQNQETPATYSIRVQEDRTSGT